MRSKYATWAAAGVLGVLLVGCVRLAWAQDERPPMLGLVAGSMGYSLQERSKGGLIGLRIASPLEPLGTGHWLLEPSVDYGWYQADSGERRHLAVFEAQLQVRPGGNPPAQLFAGLGGGLGVKGVDSTASHPRRTFSLNLTFSASVGGRFVIAQNWGAVGELRLRRINLFRGWTRELTAGLFVTL